MRGFLRAAVYHRGQGWGGSLRTPPSPHPLTATVVAALGGASLARKRA